MAARSENCTGEGSERQFPAMPQDQPQAVLEVLMNQAQGYADFSLRRVGHVPPTMLAETPKGMIHFMPPNLADGHAKDNFANTARLICIAHEVSAVVLILESWMKMAKADEALDPTELPSEALDRQEVVVLLGEAAGQQQHRFLPIVRSDNGDFFGFGDFDGPQLKNFEGRFAQVMPPKKPDAKARILARAMLERLGVTEKSLGGRRSLR